MTVRYNDYTAKYDSDHSWLDDVDFSVMAVDNTYIPDVDDRPEDVTGVINNFTSVLTGDVIVKNSMSEIIDTIKMAVDASGIDCTAAKWYVVWDESLDILCFAEEINGSH